MSTHCFLALKTVVDQLQADLNPSTRQLLQRYVLQQLPLAGLDQDQFQRLEHWLKGGIASSVGDLTPVVAGAVLHYFEVGLSEYLGPDTSNAALQQAFDNARERLASQGIDPAATLLASSAA